MSEPAAERPAGGERRILGMPRGVVIVGGITLFIAVGIMWWRNRSSATAAGQTSATDTSGIDYGGELSTLQSEYGNLASEISAMQGGAAPTGSSMPAGPAGPPAKPPVRIKPKPPVRTVPPARAPAFTGRYIVRRGETLASIARKFGVSRAELAHANGLGTGAGLRTGRVLKVPARKAA